MVRTNATNYYTTEKVNYALLVMGSYACRSLDVLLWERWMIVGNKVKRLADFNDLADNLELVGRDIYEEFKVVRLEVLQRDGLTESCGSCTTAGCCYQSVSATLVDAIPIARRLRREGKSTEEFRTHLRDEGKAMESMSIGKWFNLARPCVFLTGDKRCSIYEYRPIACANHVVVSAPENCDPPSSEDKPVGLLTQDPINGKMFYALNLVQQWLGISLDKPIMGPLPKMVAIVLEALLLPWEQFGPYIEKHGAFTRELINILVPDAELKARTAKTLYPVNKEKSSHHD